MVLSLLRDWCRPVTAIFTEQPGWVEALPGAAARAAARFFESPSAARLPAFIAFAPKATAAMAAAPSMGHSYRVRMECCTAPPGKEEWTTPVRTAVVCYTGLSVVEDSPRYTASRAQATGPLLLRVLSRPATPS